ncbi:hypothetical protein [Salinispora arenicola]|uniref:hypothetical protein n=1 Tax=Salinispora arenicola TaxID=168697 RepID=UPI0016A78367|nr:hypothetical protein [Salinispora arenicola]NIL59171.1 hypothetical protein [Salinispora arenicola]NIL63725.1 hypothetical protein [Salinispora arenicola]
MRSWRIFTAAALANVVLMVAADDMARRMLHAVSTVAFTVAALATARAGPVRVPSPARRHSPTASETRAVPPVFSLGSWKNVRRTPCSQIHPCRSRRWR